MLLTRDRVKRLVMLYEGVVVVIRYNRIIIIENVAGISSIIVRTTV